MASALHTRSTRERGFTGTSSGCRLPGTEPGPAPATRAPPTNPLGLGDAAPILEMRKRRRSEVRGVHSSGRCRAGTSSHPLRLHSQRAWRGRGRGGGGGAGTHTGRCCSRQAGLPLLRPGPRTRCQPPTPAAWQTLLSETKPRSCHPREDNAFAAHRPLGRCQACPF